MSTSGMNELGLWSNSRRVAPRERRSRRQCLHQGSGLGRLLPPRGASMACRRSPEQRHQSILLRLRALEPQSDLLLVHAVFGLEARTDRGAGLAKVGLA